MNVFRDVKRKSSSARESLTTDIHSQLFQALSLRYISSRIKMVIYKNLLKVDFHL